MKQHKKSMVVFVFMVMMLVVIACSCGSTGGDATLPTPDDSGIGAQDTGGSTGSISPGTDSAGAEVEATEAPIEEEPTDEVTDDGGGMPVGTPGATVFGQDVETCALDDGLVTTQVEAVEVGTTVTGNIAGFFDVQTWVFEGTAGQEVTITVESEADPKARLFGPDCTELASADDNFGASGYDTQITFTLPEDGLYQIRITTYDEGDYTLTLE